MQLSKLNNEVCQSHWGRGSCIGRRADDRYVKGNINYAKNEEEQYTELLVYPECCWFKCGILNNCTYLYYS